MTSQVEAAVAEIRASYGEEKVDMMPLDDGGARVIVRDLFLSDTYDPNVTWVGFIISFQYPYADVYPHYLDAKVKRRDGAPLGERFSGTTTWQDRECIQVSQSSKQLDATVDTADLKLAKVLDFIRTR
jgi:hypothetical protein